MKQIIIYCICAFFLSTVQAQVLDNLLERADSLYTSANANLDFPQGTSTLFPFSTSIPEKYNISQNQIKLKKLEAVQFKQDIGLVFKANSNYSFRDAFDEEQNNFSRFRLRAELEWNILKEGFVHNQTKAQQTYNEIENLKQQSQDVKKELWRHQFKMDYNYIANNEAIELFTHFINFENTYFDFLNKLYTENLIKREPLIKVGNQIHILENQLQLLRQENYIIKDSISKNALLKDKLPIFSIKADSISAISELRNNSFLQENIQLQHKAINDLSLSIYINQSINYSLAQTQYFPAIGIRFKAPIRFNKRQEITKAKRQLLSAKQKNKNVGHYNALITYINSYNEKLKYLQNQYKSWNVVEERIRALKLMKVELNAYSTGLLILELTEEKFKILESVIQIKRQLYTTISHLYELCPIDNLQDILVPYIFKKTIEKENILFTESTKHSLEFQYQYIKTKTQFSILVLLKDRGIQNYLKGKDVEFSIVDKTNVETISQLISRELKKLNK